MITYTLTDIKRAGNQFETTILLLSIIPTQILILRVDFLSYISRKLVYFSVLHAIPSGNRVSTIFLSHGRPASKWNRIKNRSKKIIFYGSSPVCNRFTMPIWILFRETITVYV